jgi:hypothetical protein
MAWQDEAIPLLRTLLSDAGCGTSTYTETRLEELLLASAHMIIQDITFDTTYTVSISSATITPDPADDTEFINFMVLKAACFSDEGVFRQRALAAGIEARCGPAVLKTTQHIAGFQTLLTEGPCKTYDEMKFDFEFGKTDHIKAILSPFAGNDFDPYYQRDYVDDEHRDRWWL